MIHDTIVRLIKEQDKVFYGHLLTAARKIPDPTLPAPAAVSVTDGINLFYNPIMWEQLEPNVQEAILEHEVLHIVFDHVLDSRLGERDRQLWNYAVDCVVNQYINIPSKFMMGEREVSPVLPKTFGYPGGQNAEYYYSLLKQDMPPMPEVSMDDHAKWQPHSNREGAKAVVYDALQTAKNRAHGNVPSLISQALDKYGNSTVNWKTVLRQFIYASVSANKRKTRKRVNRRYGTTYPGRRKDYYAHIVCANDVSGSVSDESIQKYYVEMSAIAKTVPVKITVVEADCEVTQVFEFDPKKPIQIKGRGGTAYQPALDKAAELKADAVIYFGDMDSADTPTKPRYPVLWACVQGGSPPVSWGKKLEVK